MNPVHTHPPDLISMLFKKRLLYKSTGYYSAYTMFSKIRTSSVQSHGYESTRHVNSFPSKTASNTSCKRCTVVIADTKL
jgi:hypothetical protein